MFQRQFIYVQCYSLDPDCFPTSPVFKAWSSACDAMRSDGTFREILWKRNWALWRKLVLSLSVLGYHEVKIPPLPRFLSQGAHVTKLLWTETSEFMSQIPVSLKLILCLFSLGDMNKCFLPTIGHC